jgi:hypothetical protein
MALVSSVTTNALNRVHCGRIEVSADHIYGRVVHKGAIVTIVVAKVSFALATKQVLTMRFSLMDTALATLSESLLAAIDATYERFLARVRIHVLRQVLLK